MKNQRLRKFPGQSAVAYLCQLTCLLIGQTATANELPPFERVTAAMTAYFKSLPDYQPNDLVSQQNVSGALKAIAQAGWEVPYADRIAQFALADDSFLVRELATPRGKQFMREIAPIRGGYSRLDRLSNSSGGQDTVKILIHDPDGNLMITYMATTPGGKNLGAMMAATPDGTDLNKPTGRIYTADDLLALIKRIYAIESESRLAPMTSS